MNKTTLGDILPHFEAQDYIHLEAFSKLVVTVDSKIKIHLSQRPP